MKQSINYIQLILLYKAVVSNSRGNAIAVFGRLGDIDLKFEDTNR